MRAADGFPGTSRLRALAIALLSLAGLVTVGRFALDAWLVKPDPEPSALGDAVPAARIPAPAAGTTSGRAPPFLLAIVDGLRAESAEDGPDPAMPFWVSLAKEGASGIAVTGEPTMTACCVRTILTGRNPDIYTAFRNFDAAQVSGSVVEFLARRGARIAHAGDAAAWQMTSSWYRPEDVKAFPDRGPIDQGETDDAAFPFALLKARDDGVDVLTVHFVRPDHAGHRHGATGPEYRAACRVVDGMLREVVTAFRKRRPGATVLLAADHGVTPRGNHGGGEPGARRAPFVLAGPRVAARSGVETPQSSLAPTVSALLGLPQPPLAESPPAFDLTTLPPAERAAALDAYVVARLDVARRTGAADLAEAIEAKRARAFASGNAVALETLAALQRDLDAGAFERTGTLPATAALLLAALWIAVLARAVAGGAPAHVGTPGGGGLEAALAAVALVAAFRLPDAVAAATLLLACGVLAWRTPWAAGGARALTLSAFAAVPVLGAAGLALQDAFDDPMGARAVAWRAGIAVLAVAFATTALLRRDRVREAARSLGTRHPGALAALGGVVLGFPLTMRLFLDPFVHTPILFALAAGAGVGALLLRPEVRARVPAADRLVVLACAALLFLGGRVAVLAWDDDWILGALGRGAPWRAALLVLAAALAWAAVRGGVTRGDRAVLFPALAALAAALALRWAAAPLWWATLATAVFAIVVALFRGSPRARLDARLLAATALAVLLHERSDAQAAGFAVLAIGCRFASGFPAARTRVGVVLVALLLLAVRTAVFHATGFVESFSSFDVGAGVVPGAGRAAVEGAGGWTSETLANTALQGLKFSLVWVVLLAAVARAFDRDGAREALPFVATDLAVAFAARGAAIVAGLWVWWRSSWWLKYAYPVYALAAADVVLLLLAFAAVGCFRRAEPARGESAALATA